MSYIQCVAIGSFINGVTPQVIITSDGRVTGENGEIIQEDYNKIDRISSKIAIAYAGNKFLCEKIIKDTKDSFDKLDSIYIEDFHKNLVCISKSIFNTPNNQRFKCQFLIGGAMSNNSLGVMTLSTNNNFQITKHSTDSNNPICFASASSDSTDNTLLNQNLNKLVNENKQLSISNFYKVINDTSREVSLMDNTVNSKIFKEIIKL